MAGRKGDYTEQEMIACYVENLKYAASRLSECGITALIEPINSRLSVPGYLLDTVDKGTY